MPPNQTKLISAFNGALIALVFFTDFTHVTNSWVYELLIRVPVDFNNHKNKTERIIENQRYLVIDGEYNFKSKGHAMAQSIIGINEKITEHEQRQKSKQ